MQVKSRLDTFLSSTNYTRPAEIKKLKFILSAIDRYVSANNKAIENLHILEVGCGRGGITFPLASLSCQVRAFDVDKNVIEYVQSQIDQNRIKNLIVSVDDGYKFDDGQTYDLVVVSEVLQYVLEPSELAANITRRMVEGSCLIVTIPNGYGPWELKNRVSPISYLIRWNWLRHLLGKPPYIKGGGALACQFFTKERLVKLFSRFSLRLIDFAKSDSFLAALGPLYKKSDLLGDIDIKLADLLPYWLASGWYFVFEMERGEQG